MSIDNVFLLAVRLSRVSCTIQIERGLNVNHSHYYIHASHLKPGVPPAAACHSVCCLFPRFAFSFSLCSARVDLHIIVSIVITAATHVLRFSLHACLILFVMEGAPATTSKQAATQDIKAQNKKRSLEFRAQHGLVVAFFLLILYANSPEGGWLAGWQSDIDRRAESSMHWASTSS